MRRRGIWFTLVLAALAVLLFDVPDRAEAQSLQGSRASLIRQRQWARDHEFTYLATVGDVSRFVRRGLLVSVRGNSDYETHGVSFPYARPEVATFLTRLASQYRRGCGERLVVTSLTRPTSRQPRNASRLSVHPTGMAVDLRLSQRAACRRWIEETLLSLEKQGVLEATRERFPPHYHLALFPNAYLRYVARLEGESQPAEPAMAEASRPTVSEPGVVAASLSISEPGGANVYRVRPGDSLWTIAKTSGVEIDLLKKANGLRSTKIRAGKTLLIPVSEAGQEPQPAVSIVGDAQDAQESGDDSGRTYRVRRGDSLWSISRETGVSVQLLKKVNGLRSSRIGTGQTLVIPLTS